MRSPTFVSLINFEIQPVIRIIAQHLFAFSFLHLLIEADTQDETYNGDPPLFDSLDKFRIEGNEWQEVVIEAYVPGNAHTITYSAHLRDFGTVWIDAIQIEIIE